MLVHFTQEAIRMAFMRAVSKYMCALRTKYESEGTVLSCCA